MLEMKKFILLTALILPVVFFSCKKDRHSDPYKGRPCVTLDATNIGPVTATLNGYFNPDTLAHFNYYFFLVCGNKSQCDIDSLFHGAPVQAYQVLSEDGTDVIKLPSNHKLKTTAFNLKSDSTYYVRALIYLIDTVMHRETFTQADNIKSFSTKSLSVNVFTQDATDIGSFTAALNGKVETNAGKGADVEGWFIYGPEGSTLEQLKNTGNTTSRKDLKPGTNLAFSDTLKDLSYLTTYSYVACARISGKDYYGEVQSFTTADFNLAVTTLAPNAGAIKAALSATVSPSFKGKSAELWFAIGPAGSTIESLTNSPEIKIDASAGRDYASFTANTPLLKMSTTYCVAAFARIIGKEAHGDVISFTTGSRTVPSGAVEMGLSVFWAPKNIGADSPEGYGGFYAWGEVETKTSYDTNNYKWSNGERSGANGYTKYVATTIWGPVVDNKFVLEPEDDAATAVLGDPWRMPSPGEWQELIDYCNWEKKTIGEHPGYEITSRLTGNSIFLPALAFRSRFNTEIKTSPVYYFSNKSSGTFTCWVLLVDNDVPTIDTTFREYGTNIRAVREQ